MLGRYEHQPPAIALLWFVYARPSETYFCTACSSSKQPAATAAKAGYDIGPSSSCPWLSWCSASRTASVCRAAMHVRTHQFLSFELPTYSDTHVFRAHEKNML